MRPRRVAILAVGLAITSAAAWALVERGRPAELPLVPPIVIREGSKPGPGTNPDKESKDPEPSEPGGSGGNASGGAAPPPAPPPPPAGDDDADDDGGGDADD